DYTSGGTEQTRKLIGILFLDQLSHRPDVAAGAKGAARTGDHHNVNSPVATSSFQSLSQIATHVPGQGIQFLRTIQRDRGDARIFSDVYLFVHKKKAVNGEWQMVNRKTENSPFTCPPS